LKTNMFPKITIITQPINNTNNKTNSNFLNQDTGFNCNVAQCCGGVRKKK